MWSAPGYAPAESEPMQVLPEHSDVNADLRRLAAPAVLDTELHAAGVEVGFDTWMRVSTVAATLTAGAAR